MLKLRENYKYFFVGLINQVSTLFDAKIGKINEELKECNKNYHDMRLELESITNESRIPSNSTLQWGPQQSLYSPNMGTSNNGMPKARIIVP
jgi:hypothetical protein